MGSVTEAAKPKVFISYSRRDTGFVDKLNAALQDLNVEPQIDRSDIYAFEDWWKRIEVLIGQADIIVFVLSPEAIASETCQREIDHATALNKRIAPLVLRPVDERCLPEVIKRLNFVYFTDETAFNRNVGQFAEALQTNIGWVRKHTEFGMAARLWDGAMRPRGLLLRSPLLDDAELWLASRPHGVPSPTEDTQYFIYQSRRTTTQRRNILTASLAIGLVTAIGLSGVAYWQKQTAVEQRSIAESNRQQATRERDQALIAQSRFLGEKANVAIGKQDFAAAALLALEALPEPEAKDPRPVVDGVASILQEAIEQLHERKVFAGHGAEIWSANFSSDGKTLVTASEDDTAKVWDAATGKPLVTLTGHLRGVRAANFNPDGKIVVTAGLDGARLWDAESGQERAVLVANDSHGVQYAEFSPDGKIVVTVGEYVQLWSADTGAEIRVLGGRGDSGKHAAFSRDGILVAVAANDNTARLWNVATGQATATLKGHTRSLNWVCFHPDGNRVLTASDDGTARVWDAAAGLETAVLTGHENYVWRAAFSPNGSTIVTASQDLTARLWDAETGKQTAVLNGHASTVVDARFTPDGKTVVTASIDGTARIWNAETGDPVAVLDGHLDGLSSAVINLEGTLVLTASRDKTARLWRLRSKDAAKNGDPIVLAEHKNAVWSLAFSPNGKTIVTGSADQTARIWDVTSGKAVAVLRGHKNMLCQSSFSPDGSLVLTSSHDRTARLWNSATGEQIAVLEGHGSQVCSAVFSPNGKTIATASFRDRTARLWNTDTRRVSAVLTGHTGAVSKIAFSPDSSLVATSSEDGTARLWRTATGEELKILRPAGDAVALADVLFSPAGTQLAVAANEATVRLYDVASGQQIAAFTGDKYMIRSIAFSPDGKTIAIASLNSARLWDIATGSQIANLKGSKPKSTSPYPGESTAFFVTVGFSPVGKTVLTTSEDETARVWNAIDGSELMVLRGHTGRVSSGAYSPDGKTLATASDDQTTRLWHGAVFSLQALINKGLAEVPRCLTETQRVDLYLERLPSDWCYEMEKWPYQKSRFGLFARTLNANDKKHLPWQADGGVFVWRVVKGAPANAGGLEAGDVVVRLEGKPVKTYEDFSNELGRKARDEATHFTIIRAGVEKTLDIRPRF